LLAATQYLHHGVGLTERKVPDVLHQLCGVKITQSAVSQASKRTTAAGTPMAEAYGKIKDAVQTASVVHQDDTGWRINGVQAWLQVACTTQHVLFQIRSQHTHQQLKELLGITFEGTLVADRAAVYDHAMFADRKHQKCIRHVIRNIEEAVVLQESRRGRGIVYATRLLQAFQDAHGLHRQFSREELTLEEYRGAGNAIKARITALLNHPPLQSAVNERLRKGLLKHHGRGSLLRFLDDPSIPPTNNAAERDLRPGVSARKVSQCSKTQRGADSYAMLKSVVETARRHKQHPLDVLVGLQVRAAPR
jgi:transposase